MADEAPGLPARQFGDVGVLLLGQHRAARGVGIVELEEPELLGRPQHDLLTQPRQVHAQEGQIEQGLGDEVTIADGVQRVLEPGREAQVLGDLFGVEGERRPGEGAGAQRGDVEAPPGVEDPVDVAAEGPGVGQQVVSQEHGLGPLEVGVAGQVGIGRRAGAFVEHLLEGDNAACHLGELALGEQAHRGRHLVVAAATGVQLAARRAGNLAHPPLDGGVDVLVAREEAERPVRQLVLDAVEGREEDAHLLFGQHAGPHESPHVGARAGYVVDRQPPVEADAGRERHQCVRRPFAHAPLPERHVTGPPSCSECERPWRRPHVPRPPRAGCRHRRRCPGCR